MVVGVVVGVGDGDCLVGSAVSVSRLLEGGRRGPGMVRRGSGRWWVVVGVSWWW